MHAQATAPEGARATITWLDALFPATAAETTGRPTIRRRAHTPQTFARATDALRVSADKATPLPRPATLLLHDSNAP